MGCGMGFHEIADANDDYLAPWLRVYELSFPAEERVLVSGHVFGIQGKAEGLYRNSRWVAALDDSGKLAGIMAFGIWPELCYLLYPAVDPELQGRGCCWSLRGARATRTRA